MLVATDVHYVSDAEARAAALVFDTWASADPSAEYTHTATEFAAYEPGKFFKRELPCLLPLLRDVLARHPIHIVIVDGFVDLPAGPGLGRHVHAALAEVAVVGVAKNPYPGAPAVEVHRGSTQPLFVSAAGIGAEEAARCVESMAGPHRFPALLLRTDHLARGLAP